MRPPATLNGGCQHWTMLNNGVALDAGGATAVENGKSNGNNDYGDGEFRPIVYSQSNGADGSMGNTGGDEDEYLDLVNELSYKDDRHKDLLLSMLNTFRRDRELCDVVLLVNKREIFAHKPVLAAVSPTLFELLTKKSSPDKQQRDDSPILGKASSTAAAANGVGVTNGAKNGVDAAQDLHSPTVESSGSISRSSPAYLEFNDVDFDCFDALIKYAYSGSLEISKKKVADLYKTASRLRMRPCAVACAKYLVQQLNPQNCIGFRRCANRVNDYILAGKVDAYIQENFATIFESSKEFLTLPSVQIEVVLSASNSRSDIGVLVRDERRLAEKVLDWLQQYERDLPEYTVFRMEMLTEKTHMLFVDADSILQDCCELEDSSAAASCDLIRDYKKSSRRSSIQLASVSKTRSKSNVPVLASPGPKQQALGRVSSTESLNSICSAENEEIEWKIIASLRTSERYCTALAVIHRQLTVISIRVIDGSAVNDVDALLSEQLDRLRAANDDATECSPLAMMQVPRCSVGAVCLRGKLLVCGGYDRGECLSSVEQYDPSSNSWAMLPSMNKERGRFDAAVVDDKVFAVGGSDGARDLNTAERFDSEDQHWKKIAPMANARSNHGVVSSTDGYVYAIGGCQWQRPLKMCERYDQAKDAWTPIAPMQQARYQAGCCALSNEIVAVGGFDTWNCTSSVECYDPHSNTWRSLPPLGIARRGCGVAVVNEQLYVIGGSDGTQTLMSVEVLDLSDPQATWRPAPPLNTPRDNVRAVVLPDEQGRDRLYAVGGFNGKSFLNSIEYLDEAAHEWKTAVLKHKSSTNADLESMVIEDGQETATESESKPVSPEPE